jgi:hypothetical protein
MKNEEEEREREYLEGGKKREKVRIVALLRQL